MGDSGELLDRIQRYVDGMASADDVARLQAALHASPDLRQAFLDYVHIDSALEATAAAGVDIAARRSHAPVRRARFRWPVWAGMAAALVVLCGIWIVRSRMLPGVDAEVVHSEGSQTRRVGERMILRKIDLREGVLSLRLAQSNVRLRLSAPVEAQFESPLRMRVVHGRVSADVGAGGIGFTIATDAGEVVDLGTSFGVEAERGGESRVAVFSGQVKVRPGPAGGRDFTTLSEGEAVRFSAVAGLRRWQQVALAAEAAGLVARAGSAVIGTVRDNLGEGELHPFYGVVASGMRRDALAFTDKPNPRWAPGPEDTLPPWLEGADLIRMYHQFRHRNDFELALTLQEPATVFVLAYARQPVPSWLRARFADTGARVVVGPWQPGMKAESGAEVRADGHPYLTFAVWRAEAEPGEFKLGAPRELDRDRYTVMYGVAVKPRAR